MKVDVAKINDKVLKVEEDISAESWEMGGLDVKFIDNIHVSSEFTRIDKEILVCADIVLNREITCSRCLNHSKQIIKQNLKKSYDINTLSESLDINSDLREEVLINFPMKVLCKDNCRGLCSGCGVDLNLEKCKCKK